MNFNDINSHRSNFRLRLENSTLMDRIQELENEVQYLKDKLQTYESLILNATASSDDEEVRSNFGLNVNNTETKAADVDNDNELDISNTQLSDITKNDAGVEVVPNAENIEIINTSNDIYAVYSQLYASYEELSDLYTQQNVAYNQIKQEYDSLHNMYENLALTHKQIKLRLGDSVSNNNVLQRKYDELYKLYIELKNKSNSDEEYVKIDYL
jgi:hypothetical protein